MTRYRIKPFGDRSWLVQHRWLFLWLDCTRMTGPDYFERITFSTEAEAEQWIDNMIVRERNYDAMKREQWLHEHRNSPREYPNPRALANTNPTGAE